MTRIARIVAGLILISGAVMLARGERETLPVAVLRNAA